MTGITQRPGGFSYQRMTNVSPATWQVFSPAGRVAALTYSARDAERVADALGYQQQPAPPSAPVGVEASLRNARDYISRNGFGHDAAERIDEIDTALAQQPAAVGEEIMVNAAHDVFTLPLQPSGLSSGPRFVVHVPGPEAQPAEQQDESEDKR